MSSTKQRKRRRRRRLVLFLVLGGIGYAVRRAQAGQSGQAGRSDLGSSGPYGPRPPARATSATPRPAAEKLAEKPAESPYGPDSRAALDDGEQPEGFPIKGNVDSMLYHVPGSSFYNRTVAEVWFRSAQAAQAAGFQRPPSQRAKDQPAEPAEPNPQPVAETIPGTEGLDPAPAKKAPAKKAPAKAAAKKAPAKKPTAKKAPAKKTPPPPADE